MTVVLISSTTDPASVTIKNQLLKQDKWEQTQTFQNNPVFVHSTHKNIYLLTINDQKIFHDHLDKEIQQQLHISPTQAIFLSRHRSKTGQPSLTVHPIGNYTDAKFGGKPRTLVPSSPHLMTQLLRLIKKHGISIESTYQICYEVTHHGPYLEIPTLFVEVGSTEQQWTQKKPAQIIAKALMELFEQSCYETDFSSTIPALVGIGGGHYAPRFTDIVFEKNTAFGHMIPGYHLQSEDIDVKIIKTAIKNTPNVHGIYLHKKSLKKSQITKIKNMFNDSDTPVISSTQLPSF